ncbi:pentapeptide repeat-containing protein [Kribbella sp. NPDC059898]|uniref:pentapeptide repeat-containing protein n=1 Tax=Kribbella sp. NPDC059898 TaxID=3346995 RepID=UPI003663D33C
MSPVQSGDPKSELAAARDAVRNAAKWFFTGLGAIAAILVAGSQLSSLGALDAGSTRFRLAVVGVVLGLLAVLWAMSRVVDLLAGSGYTFEHIEADWRATENPPTGRFALRRNRSTHAVGWFLRENSTLLANFTSPLEIGTAYRDSGPEREGLGDLLDLMDLLVDESNTIHLQARFRRLRRQIAVGVMIGAVGIVLFAWAANPPDLDQPPASLRNANLRGADLHGTSLRNADISGADLTRANLFDADLRGAKINNVVWSATICPDGVNSDSTASSGRNDGTCDGHLTPTHAGK